MSMNGRIGLAAFLAAWLLYAPGRAGAGDPATHAVEESDLAFSVQVLKVPPSTFDGTLREHVARQRAALSRVTRYACPDTLHIFVFSEATNATSDTLRFCGMIDHEGGFRPSLRDSASRGGSDEGIRRCRPWPAFYRIPKTHVPDDPFRCRSVVLAPGEAFADTLHSMICLEEFRIYPGTYQLAGSFLVGEPGITNGQARILVEQAIEADIPIP